MYAKTKELGPIGGGMHLAHIPKSANAKYNAHTDPIFGKNILLKLNDIIKFHMCKFGYKLYHKIHPRPLLNIFTKNSEGLSRNRQVTHHMNIPNISKHSSKLYNNSYLCKSISNWTKLPQSVKSSPLIFSFKRSCFTHLISSYHIIHRL